MFQIKVLFLVSTLKSGGMTNTVYNIVKYLRLDNFQAIILTFSPEPKNSSFELFKELGIEVYSLGLNRWEGIIKGRALLKDFIATYQPDIVFSHGLRPDIYSAQYLQNFKRFSTLHNYPYYDYEMLYGKARGYLMAWQHIRALRSINFPIACSKSIANSMQKHDLNLHVVQNGVDNQFFSPAIGGERLALRKKLDIPLHKNVFVSVGSLIKRKDPVSVVKGFLDSQASKKGFLLMIGDGNLRKQCEETASKSKSIRFTGQIRNVADYLKCSDYFISASFAEGLPNSVVEGLSCGLPVCISNIAPHQEILKFDDRLGLTFTPGNSDELSTQLEKLINIDYQLVSNLAVKVVAQSLSAERMSESYQNFFCNHL